jgi:hypothetical protein
MDEYTDEERAEDRRLLELAARAAGIDGTWDDVESSIRYSVRPRGTTLDHWNPLYSGHEALRLAVKLNLRVSIECESAGCVTIEWSFDASGTPPIIVVEPAPAGGDDLYATCRAIVRAAAEITVARAKKQA